MGRIKLITMVVILLTCLNCLGQVNRYLVFFTDKNGSEFSIDQPEDYLSSKSIFRRQKQGIAIDQSDLPVNSSYINALKDDGIDVFFKTKWLNGVLVQTDQSNVSLIESLSFVSEVELVAEKERLTQSPPKSGRTGEISSRLKESKTTAEQNAMLSIDDMHANNYLGQGMTIAVFDGGFENVDVIEYFSHVFTDDRLSATYDFVTNSEDVFRYDDHGTRVFSAIAGYSESSYSGTAHRANFILCVTEDILSETRIEEYNWLFAAEFADSVGVDVINTSLGYNIFDDPEMNYTQSDLDGGTAVITLASNLAASKGIFLVASAGNEGDNSWGKITPPADSPVVLAVGGITQNGELSSFSSVGPTSDDRIKPDVVALGTGVSLISSNGSIVTGNGTSFSSPLIAGFAAGVWQANPDLTNLELLDLIRSSASNATSPDNSIGYGLPDFLKTTDGPILSVDDILSKRIKVYPNPFKGNRIYIDIDSRSDTGSLQIELYSLSGVLLGHRLVDPSILNGVIHFEINTYIAPGTYLLKIISKSDVNEVKLIKY